MDNKFVFTKEGMEIATGAIGRFAESVSKVLQPAMDAAITFHEFMVLHDEEYARKFRRFKKYKRMYERGKRKHG